MSKPFIRGKGRKGHCFMFNNVFKDMSYGEKCLKVKRRNSRYTKILTYKVCRGEKIRKVTDLE